MLLELAIGDAYGAGFEYVDLKLIQSHNDLSRYVKHPRHATLPGAYTDDTQMSIAIAEAIVSEEAWTAENLANRFVEAFKRDPREGYASGFYNFLVSVQNGAQLLVEIRPDSDKSGAAMRAAPIGVVGSIDEVLEKTAIQAAITHNTIDGINAAKAAALMSHYFIYKIGAKAELGKFVESHVTGDWSSVWKGKVGAKGWMSVRAAITAVTRNERMSDLLKDCINFSGDVDTVATIALAAASCSEEIQQDLPPVLRESLENGAYGREYLIELNKELMKQVKG
jgi:ADP-ribosyl-[dinitrogen reductase] hydrolase